MSMIIRTVVAIPLLVFFTLMSWFGWQFLDPLATEMADAGSAQYGMFDAVWLLVSLVFQYAFPMLAVVVVGWWIFGAIRTDAHFHGGAR